MLSLASLSTLAIQVYLSAFSKTYTVAIAFGQSAVTQTVWESQFEDAAGHTELPIPETFWQDTM